MDIRISDSLILTLFSRAWEQNLRPDAYINDILIQVVDRIENEDKAQITIGYKQKLSEQIISNSFEKYGANKLCVAWTGGKDSTLLVWLVLQVVREQQLTMPRILFINEGQMFDEVETFVAEITNKWQLVVDRVQNDDVLKQIKQVGDGVVVSNLDRRNQKEIIRVGYDKKTFLFEPESLVGNHLMKTVALNRYLEKNKFIGVMTGIRWDEQGARQYETYFSTRGDNDTPTHTRIHPLLHVTEADVWKLTQIMKIPYCPLYEQGYRSLGASGTTKKVSDKPAWEQDFDTEPERAGRQQDKESIMQKLRDLGYM